MIRFGSGLVYLALDAFNFEQDLCEIKHIFPTHQSRMCLERQLPTIRDFSQVIHIPSVVPQFEWSPIDNPNPQVTFDRRGPKSHFHTLNK